ncbi:hypothetical protein [Niallia endozanthoxylica]|uniref:Uncharacterized protein n=1 Tax=Niallia endozanthoxylica TaxID=2036016 RepID=A0A5J5HT93_9BACI|nr:hypothetical protein [Niallia endozanthoxylica]KAA9023556.1 hypothetical protein F4V44_12880 [Niallia endozanthoxylica]
MKRKYLAEFALHTYSSHVTMSYPNDLDLINDGHDYHIYMINLIPKLTYIDNTLEIFEHFVTIDVLVKKAEVENVEKLRIRFADVDHRDYNYNLDKPKKTLSMLDEEGGGIGARVLPVYLQFSQKNLDTEIIYIGRSFGKNGERNAFHRLKSHSTLQKIQADVMFNEPGLDLAITLWEFTPRLLSSFDGITKQYQKSMEEDYQHMLKIANDPPLTLKKDIIAITEAALIHYFKPEYNNDYKYNFPSEEHKDYNYYYEFDYNAVCVELDPSAIDINIFSKEKQYSLFKSIEYPLHSEEERRSFFKFVVKDGFLGED